VHLLLGVVVVVVWPGRTTAAVQAPAEVVVVQVVQVVQVAQVGPTTHLGQAEQVERPRVVMAVPGPAPPVEVVHSFRHRRTLDRPAPAFLPVRDRQICVSGPDLCDKAPRRAASRQG